MLLATLKAALHSLFLTSPLPLYLWQLTNMLRSLCTGESLLMEMLHSLMMPTYSRVLVGSLLLRSRKDVSTPPQLGDLEATRIPKTKLLLFLLKRKKSGEPNSWWKGRALLQPQTRCKSLILKERRGKL